MILGRFPRQTIRARELLPQHAANGVLAGRVYCFAVSLAFTRDVGQHDIRNTDRPPSPIARDSSVTITGRSLLPAVRVKTKQLGISGVRGGPAQAMWTFSPVSSEIRRPEGFLSRTRAARGVRRPRRYRGWRFLVVDPNTRRFWAGAPDAVGQRFWESEGASRMQGLGRRVKEA